MTIYEEYIKAIKPLISMYNLDPCKVEEMVNSLNLNGAMGKERYITTAITNHKNELVKEWNTISFNSLFRDFEAKGFVGKREELTYISFIVEHALNEFPIKVAEMSDMLKCCFNEAKEKNYQSFCRVLANKLKGRANIPYKYLWDKAQQETKEWEKLIEEVESVPPQLDESEVVKENER